MADPLADDLLRVIARLNRWATREAGLEIPHAQARLLATLDELGPSRVSALAKADQTSQPTATTQVERLISGGWAIRKPDPTDARASLIELTDQGVQMLADLRRARSQALAPALATFDTAQRSDLRDAVTTLELLLAATRT